MVMFVGIVTKVRILPSLETPGFSSFSYKLMRDFPG